MSSAGRDPIAIIGMSGRYPGASTMDQFWSNLRDGVESIQRIPDRIVETRRDPQGNLPANFVPRGSYLADTEWFDHQFFGLSLRDAKLMDPQQRLFIEHVWTAIEDAGYNVEKLGERVAVYGGGGPSRHILDALDAFGHDYGTMFEVVATGVANAMVMRASFLLNLLGESIYIYTACSTTLVAIDMACRALLDGRADVAIAGGTALWLPQLEGYEHVPGMILSADGHCRAFDARASGTVWGNGVGVVVLKPLEEALRDRDPVRAVIIGSSVNNDGRFHKLSFAAPSAEGQADAISMAYGEAGISPDTITYVEAHGTGTEVGDPLEMAGLHRVFGKSTGPRTCAIGSVKTNIGHLDPVAGVASLAKTVLALERGQIPPTLHFETPNPEIDFAAGPFFVNTELRDWQRRGHPRRAGINSFGVGGTNAHVIVEEAPPAAPAAASPRPRQLVTLSARTEKALDTMTRELADHLDDHAELDVADVAFTRAVGRRQFDVRRAVVTEDLPSLVRALRSPPPPVRSRVRGEQRVAFLFPGQGSQFVGMAQELHATEPEFRRDVQDCAEALAGQLKHDVREILYPEAGREDWAAAQIQKTQLTQPILFVIEYALARQWGRLGIEPAAMLGHSVGEFVAACLAGVFGPGEALMLLAARGRFIQETDPGSMLAVSCSERDIAAHLGGELDLAAVNAPDQCVVSGPVEAVSALEQNLEGNGLTTFRLPTSHAFHSDLVETSAARFESTVRRVRLRPPRIPYISNVTGTWVTEEQALDPGYWAQHMRRPVRFWDGLCALRDAGHRIFLEVGPGQALTRILGQHPATARDERAGAELALPSLRSARRSGRVVSDHDVLLGSLGTLWSHRVTVAWAGLYGSEQRRRVRLPHYPFEKAWCALYQPGEEYKLVEKALGAQRLGGSRPASAGELAQTAPPGDPGEQSAGEAAEPHATPEPVQLGERPASYQREYIEPIGECETRIAELFGRALGLRSVGADDDLLELGGHSLLLVSITNHLRAMFDVQISIRAVTENPTPATLADKIRLLIAERDRK
jgi:acyl transferase domain-containing protein